MLYEQSPYKSERGICVLYATATCNLNCRYCYIDKSPILKQIDDMLDQSFQGDYYINFMKEMFDRDQLFEIQIWGGEPTYGLHRLIPTVTAAIDYFPRLFRFTLSTNLTTTTVVDDLYEFWSICKHFPNRSFQFDLQLSLDGPIEINDYNRGQGVTEKFNKNFVKLLEVFNKMNKEIPNLSIAIHTKATLDPSVIYKLQTKEDIIAYYHFFEIYKDIFDSSNGNMKVSFMTPPPNFATPALATSTDGKYYAKTCRLIREIQNDDMSKYFKHFRNIMPFKQPDKPYISQEYCHGCHFCGSGKIILGLLPNHLISACHGGFTDLLAEYKKNAVAKYSQEESWQGKEADMSMFLFNSTDKYELVYTKEDYEKIYEPAVRFMNEESTFSVVELASLIRTVAMAQQIDSKYINEEEAIRAAHFLHEIWCGCMRDNLAVSGSKFLFQVGFIRLMLNGAMEEVLALYD